MAYKIKNITNSLDKRHPFVNTSVDIEYVQKNSVKEKIKLKVGEELIFDGNILPTSIHNLRIKKFIRVIQISDDQVAGLIKPQEVHADEVKAVEKEESTQKATIVKKNKTS
jgi:hypothetical protein